MRQLLLLIIGFCLFSCNEKPKKARNISTVEIETFLQDSTLNVRALDIYNGNVEVATSKGEFYSLFDDGKTFGKVFFNGNKINDLDTISGINFRSIAQIKYSEKSKLQARLGLSIASPARLFKDGKLVYQENHPKAFYNSMDFWNDKEGIAIGDPTDDCISIILTRDAGETWAKLSCDVLPKAIEGEAAFAASDTNIAIIGDETWVATGGIASRILYSPNKGKSWQVFNTPIIQGKETTGIYSIDFYDAKNGFAIGGAYDNADANTKNKIRTIDGGRTWQAVADGKRPGYRSCVQYIPNTDAKELVAVGFKGIDYSSDAGKSWIHLSDEGFYTIRFLNDSIAYVAGKGRISKLTFK